MKWRILITLVVAVCVTAINVSAALAAPALSMETDIPDHVTAGKGMRVILGVQNTGDEPLQGDLTVRFEFPPDFPLAAPLEGDSNLNVQCQTVGQAFECTGDVTGIQPGSQIRMIMRPVVDAGASGTLAGQILASGGGADAPAAKSFSLQVGPSGPFAVTGFDVALRERFSVPRAGTTPTEVETRIALLSEARTNFDFPNPYLFFSAPTESFRDVVVHVPPGLVGNPTATPTRCTPSQLTSQALPVQVPTCPPASQIGVVQILTSMDVVGLYNLVPPRGVPAAFGFYYNGVVVILNARIRPADNGIDIVTEKAPSSVPIAKFNVAFWGDPTSAAHDNLRGFCLNGGYGYNPSMGNCSLSTRSDVPFLRTPTSCTGSPLPWDVDVDTYQSVGRFVHNSATTPAMTGCGDNPFDPSLSLNPTTRAAHATTGLETTLSIPQDWGVSGLAPSDLKAASVQLPRGVSINPASANGLQACSDAQLRLGESGPSQCPDASKLGSVQVETPLLEEPLGGSVFLRSQASRDPASGEMYRLAIELRSDERGIAIKLPGRLQVDPGSGQLTASFDDLPQLPFESMNLRFKAGPRAPLTTPQTCGTYATHAELTPWARPGERVPVESTFTVDEGCEAAGFSPGFEAGVRNPIAGGFSPFALRVTRQPGQPNLTRLDVDLPEGELAKLAGVPVCGDVQAAAGDCPVASRVGNAVAGIGEGTSPLYIPQAGRAPTAIYLAGPYKGAPYSVLVEVPAQAGPFDLGEVLVRSALRVDPETTRVSVVSDPLPQIFGGIPIAYRDVRVEIDRPRFTVNPTDCDPTAVRATVGSSAGDSAAVSHRYQVGDCARLGFKPKLSLRLNGRTRRGGNPALTAVLTMPQKGPGANIERASVALPGSEFIAQDHLDNVCTRVQYTAGGGGGAGCPKGSVYGRAKAYSPLLDRPLTGPVYLRSNGGERELPDLVASLDGPIHVDLVGFIDSHKRTGGLRTTFARVPDAPVSRFVLKMPAGRKSLLENSTDICQGTHRAIVSFDGQNGKTHSSRSLVRANCG